MASQCIDRRKDTLLRIADVKRRTGLSTATIYRREGTGMFPAKVRLGAASVAWYQSDIETWIAQREAEPARAMAERNTKLGSGARTEASLIKLAPSYSGELASIDDLYEGSIRISDLVHSEPGIYFLWRGNELIYVGQTRSGFARIATHIANPAMIFDAVSFLRCSAADLDAVERAHINQYLPEMNRDSLTEKVRRGKGRAI